MQINLAIPLTKTQRRRKKAMRRAKRMHQELLKLLGPVCVFCGETGETCPLVIGHVKPRTWEARKVRYDARVARYWREYYEGIGLQTECHECSSGRRQEASDLEEAPF